MGIIFGFLSLFSFCLLLVKALTRKLQWKRSDGICMKIHKPLCVILLVSCIAHILCVFPVLLTRSMFVLLTGAAAVILVMAIILFCHIMKNGERRLRWHRTLSAIMLMIVGFHIVAYSIDFRDYQTQVSSIQIEGMAASGLVDGKYVGKYDVGYIYAEIEAVVQNGKIIDIEIIEHRNERGKAAEKVVDEMIREQRTDVDAVTGATNSSNVIKRAVEDALQN